MCGAGIDLPSDITRETVRALRGCDMVFYIHTDTKLLAGNLRLVCPGLRIVFVDCRLPQIALWKLIKKELDKGKRAGYITYGHPLVFSEGEQLIERCRREGYKFRILPAISAVNGILAVLAEQGKLKCGRGFCSLRPKDLLEPGRAWPASHLLIIFCAAEELKEYGHKLWTAIERHYPPGHPVHLVRLAGCEDAQLFHTLKVKALRAQSGRVGHRISLVLPALKSPR
ncbi:MAG: hypothetical protein A2285_10065 [Elusimicrobia bacterium RIFOXYA12_FULL_57_11]|nr:MAG: hypothetical protein A2285_10065 [Elusimicrobia bacterium RIFOXYA12_FULL_57_11]